MTAHSFSFEQSTLHYTKVGTGSNTLFVFHGFGQNHQAFTKLAESLSDHYTVYSFDLFFHGESTWGYQEQPLDKEFWKNLLIQFTKENSIDHFSVCGFSMGGKFALATLEAFPDRVKEIFLLAPDGIKTSIWYSLATYPTALRNLFKSMIEKPQRFQAIANFAFKIRLIDKGILRFVESQMNTEEKRKRVYLSWVVFRHLSFDINHIANLINQHQTKLVLIIGKFDKIITLKNMQRLTQKVKDYNVEVPETGHNGVIEASVDVLKKYVNQAQG